MRRTPDRRRRFPGRWSVRGAPNGFGMKAMGGLTSTHDLFWWSREARPDRSPRRGTGGGVEEFGPRGLLVRDPYASQLLNGEKVWEIRGRSTQIRGLVVIVKSGTGRAFGTANLVRVLGPLELEDLLTAPELPREEREELRRDGLPYSKTYAYVFSNPRWFERSVPYRHPSGAVTWVRLPELDLGTVQYASPPNRASQIQLV